MTEEVAAAVEAEESDSGLSPETKAFFDSGGKKAPEEKKPAADAVPKTEAKKAGDKPAAAEPKAKEGEKKPVAPKDAPDVELKKYQAAMHEEREERKKVSAQLKEESARRSALEDRFGRFIKAIEQQEQAPPDFDKDPAGHLKAREQDMQKRHADLERRLAERDQAEQGRAQMERFTHTVSGKTQAFMKETPDYADAYKFVHEIRGKELEALGVPELDGEGNPVRATMLNRWEMQLAAAALQMNKNPAGALYAQALALGYKKAEAAAPQDDSKKLDAIAKGQEAAKGLGSGGGGPVELSLERIMQMDEDEMKSFVRGKSWSKVAKLFK